MVDSPAFSPYHLSLRRVPLALPPEQPPFVSLCAPSHLPSASPRLPLREQKLLDWVFSSALMHPPRCPHLVPLSRQSGDTVLIGAVRGGHVEIVRALLQKYADIDIRGQVRAVAAPWLVSLGPVGGVCWPISTSFADLLQRQTCKHRQGQRAPGWPRVTAVAVGFLRLRRAVSHIYAWRVLSTVSREQLLTSPSRHRTIRRLCTGRWRKETRPW